ncbi:MAG: hypothetical protein EPO12_16190 [Aquabacterium sp.]|nr:MAG: hypothetical protein EPO12_16190 [Aquabacterium sp.]
MPALSDTRALLFARFAEESLNVRDEDGFRGLVRQHVQPLLPHATLLAAIGRVHFDHLQILHIVDVDYPQPFLESLPRVFRVNERPAFARWLSTRSAVVLDTGSDEVPMSEQERAEVEVIGNGRLVIHGVPDLSGYMGSFLSFAQVPRDIPADDARMVVNLLCPHLHAALCRLPQPLTKDDAVLGNLTQIEKQLLGLLAAGRTNAEIAKLRGKSPDTIRNQLYKLFDKLNVGSRAEAVSLLLASKTLSDIRID